MYLSMKISLCQKQKRPPLRGGLSRIQVIVPVPLPWCGLPAELQSSVQLQRAVQSMQSLQSLQ